MIQILVEGILILFSISLLQGLIVRYFGHDNMYGKISSGVLFGAICIMVMMNPFELSSGVFIDSRSVILSLSGVIGGPIVAIISAVMAGSYRYSLGGDGAVVGIGVIICCAILGLIFKYLKDQKKIKGKFFELLVFGVLVHAFILLIFTQLPENVAYKIIEVTALPFLVILSPAIAILGLLFHEVDRSIFLKKRVANLLQWVSPSESAFDDSLQDLLFQKIALDKHAIVSSADENGIIRYVNDHFCNISGYSKKELIGQNHRILSSGDHPCEYYKELWETISSGKEWQGEFKNRKKDGGYYWVQSTILPIMKDNGKIKGFVSIRTDISEQKNNQKIAENYANELQVLNATKTNFIASMSHEFRTPLNAIIGFSDMMKHEVFGPVDNEKYKSYIDDINESGGFLLDLVNEILDLSTMEADKYVFKNTALNVLEVSNEIISKFQPITRQNKLTINVEISDRVPTILFLDKKVKTQLFNNFISNACKFSKTGGEIIVRWDVSNDDELIFSVHDTGIGMDESLLCRIGEPFVIEDAFVSRPANEGTGLGLHVCKNFIEARGGRMSIESQLDVGTSVFAIYPIKLFLQK